MRLQKDNDLMDILKIMAPGTSLRDGLENILRAKTGGLIVIGDSEEIFNIADGGFTIDAEYSPSYVYELAKMDGAIILSGDVKRIIRANAQLMPNPSVPTFETGTRHRTADRIAKQTGNIVIAISQRRNIITIYRNNIKYVLRDSSVILGKANQALQTLEKYVSVLDKVISNLNVLEFRDLVALFDVMTAIQRTEMVMRIVWEMERYICELGNEARLISMQLNELVRYVEEDEILLIRDYCETYMDYSEVYDQIQAMSSEDLINLDQISKVLGYTGVPLVDTFISPRGYRMLHRIPRIPSNVIDNVVTAFKELKAVMEASYEQLDKVEGIGEARAKAIKNGLRRLKEQVNIDKNIDIR